MGKTRTSHYDVTEHLRTPDEMAAYLEACLEEASGDAAFIAKALGDLARAKATEQELDQRLPAARRRVQRLELVERFVVRRVEIEERPPRRPLGPVRRCHVNHATKSSGSAWIPSLARHWCSSNSRGR